MIYEIKYLETGVKTTIEADGITFDGRTVKFTINNSDCVIASVFNPSNILVSSIKQP